MSCCPGPSEFIPALPNTAAAAATLAMAKLFFPSLFVVTDKTPMIVGCRATINDGYGGIFVYSSSDTTTTFDQDGLGFIDSANRRWFRDYSGPLNLKWFGATGDGSTDDSVATQAWLTAIPTGGSGFVPGVPTFYVINTNAGLSRADGAYISISGEGFTSQFKYNGNGVFLTLVGPRFSRLENFYVVGTSAAAGGILIQAAGQGYSEASVRVENFFGASAYARRFSSSFDLNIVGGASRGTTGILCDTANPGAGPVNNACTFLQHDFSSSPTGLDYQAGAAINVIGCDFSNTTTGIEIARGTSSPSRAQNVNIIGNYFESTNGIYIGRGAYGNGAAEYIYIQNNYINATTNGIHLYKCDSVFVGPNTFGTGINTIDAGVTGTVWGADANVTDNSTVGQTTFWRPNIGGLTIAVMAATSYVKTNAKNVADLISAATAGVGARSFVLDANSATFNAAVVGGGTNKVPVFSDGSGWLIG